MIFINLEIFIKFGDLDMIEKYIEKNSNYCDKNAVRIFF